jgi:hypothetical protein
VQNQRRVGAQPAVGNGTGIGVEIAIDIDRHQISSAESVATWFRMPIPIATPIPIAAPRTLQIERGRD